MNYCVCIIRVSVDLFLHLPVQSLDREIWKRDSSDRSWSHFSSRGAASSSGTGIQPTRHSSEIPSLTRVCGGPVTSPFWLFTGPVTDLATLNLRVPGSQPFQSPPSHLNPLKTSFCTGLVLLHERQTGLREHRSPRGVPAQLPATALSQMPHVLGANMGNPQRKTQPPSAKDTKGDERGFRLGKAGEEQLNFLQPAGQASQLHAQLFCGQDTRLWVENHSFGVFCSQYHSSSGCCTCTTTAPTRTCPPAPAQGGPQVPPRTKLGQQSANET